MVLTDCPLCPEEGAPHGAVLLRIDAEVTERGAWCDRCLLPSVCVLALHVACRHGWPGASAGTVAWCRDHQEYVPVPG